MPAANSELVYIHRRCRIIVKSTMPLDRRFLHAVIVEDRNAWDAVIYYSYYGLYTYDDRNRCDTKDEAIRWVLEQRCGKTKLSITNKEGLNV